VLRPGTACQSIIKGKLTHRHYTDSHTQRSMLVGYYVIKGPLLKISILFLKEDETIKRRNKKQNLPNARERKT